MSESSIKSVEKHFVLGGRVLLHQAGGRAHRAGLDAVMLAASVSEEDLKKHQNKSSHAFHLVDLGAGVGTAGLCVATRLGACHVSLVENEKTTLKYAHATLQDPENISFRDRVTLLEADVTARGKKREEMGLMSNMAHHVIMNPPYWDKQKIRISPDETRRQAHVLGEGGLAPWFACAAAILTKNGGLSVIMPTERLPDVLKEMEGRFGDIRLFPLYKGAEEPASRVIIKAIKGSRAPMRILPGLVLHSAPEENKSRRKWTLPAEAVLKGEASLCI